MFSSDWVAKNAIPLLGSGITFTMAYAYLKYSIKGLEKEQLAGVCRDESTNDRLDAHIEKFEHYKEKNNESLQELMKEIRAELAGIRDDQNSIKVEQRAIVEQHKSNRQYTGDSLKRIESTVGDLSKKFDSLAAKKS